jgi:signal transduction histidine kinase
MVLSGSPLTLVVDDDEAIRRLLSRALTAHGLTVISAGSCTTGMNYLDDQEFALLLVDKNLPDGSGLDIIAAAREKGHRSEAIVITGYSDTESAIQAVSLGVFRYLRKPFDISALKTDIDNALETGRLRRDLANRTQDLEETNKELWRALKRVFESERRTRQVERLANIGYLAAGVAHEINNPLALLSMTIPFVTAEFNALLAQVDEDHEPEQLLASLKQIQKSLEPTQEAVDFLMRLSSDLHSLGRTENQTPTPVKIADAARSAMRLVRHQLKHKAQVEIDIPEDIVVRGQASRLVQVFINLLTNAAKAIQDNKPDQNKVSITTETVGDRVVIKVSDTGIGISESHLEKIFEPFFTFSLENNSEGSGIGLAIVKEIIDEHNGAITVTSKEGQGTTFSIAFLRQVIEVAATSIIPPDGEELGQVRRKILFITGEAATMASYEEAFGSLHNILLAKTPQQALSILSSTSDTLDAIVCDLPAYGKDQDNFAAEIQRWPDMLERIIFLSEPGISMTKGKAAGYLVLEKPLKIAALLGAIGKIPPAVNKKRNRLI